MPQLSMTKSQLEASAAIGLTLLAFFLLPFGRAVNAPLALLATWGVVLLIRHGAELWQRPSIRAMLIFVLCLWLPQFWALLHAADPARAWGSALYYPCYALAGVPLLWLALRHEVEAMLLKGLLAMAVFWSLDALLQWIAGRDLLGYPYDGIRLQGIFYPKYSIGIVLAHLLPLLLAASHRLQRRSPIWNLMLLPVVATIVLSGTRTAMILMALTFALYGGWLVSRRLLSWRWVTAGAAALVICIAAVLAASPQTRQRFVEVQELGQMNIEAVNRATSLRGSVWLAALTIAKDHLTTGIGVRGYRKLIQEEGLADIDFAHPHSFALDVLVSTGIFGLLAYLTAYLYFLARLYRYITTPEGFAGWLTSALAFLPINAHWSIYASYTLALVWPLTTLGVLLILRDQEAPVTDP